MQMMTSEIRDDVERRYRDDLPIEWSPQQRATFLAAKTDQLEQQIRQTTGPLFEHALTLYRDAYGSEPGDAVVTGLRIRAREQAIQIALGQLFEGYEEQDPEPTISDREQVIGEQLDMVWSRKPPMQRWATPWADPAEDDDLFDLVQILFPATATSPVEPAVHLLQAMRAEGMDLPASAGDPVHQWMMTELRRGLDQEDRRRAGVGMPRLHYSL
ncbi:hypothetical protein [Nocardia sp. alder85J]|uniref:hypothetical protein n=1 Tax=Nocardia sp. alder85J TaxID=2862949 RepID=UPI00225A6972|nr:hypothetical protein [Nocardia sp. alder85J]MCX4097713.1 hypothetical protein [Nocardia sp. alder85J]